ncbi:YdcH family protein [Pseudomonas shirazensis]|uniref:YdcH family protein n=1 Tax=Pseudomonas shirazensis TaxID=2745494 RepID=UPI003CFDFEB0
MPVPPDLFADLSIQADDFHALSAKDPELLKLYKDYNAKDKEVDVAERTAATDDTVTLLRKERLLIKDKIERIIHPAKS